MEAAKKGNGLGTIFKATLRWIWTILTYLFLGIVVLLIILPFAIWGWISAIRGKRGWWFGFRSGALLGVLAAAKLVIGTSTRIYNGLFLGLGFDENAPPTAAASDFLIIGHRGDPYNGPENTIEAFRKALRNGANALEIDLCLTKDGHVVVWHDWDPFAAVAKFRASGLERNQGYRPFYPDNEFLKTVPELTLAELRQHYGLSPNGRSPFSLRKGKPQIPTFEEFMNWSVKQPDLLAVFLDMKIPGGAPEWVPKMLPQMQAAIEKYSPRFECVLMSPYKDVFDAMRKEAPRMSACLDKEVIAAVFSGTESEAETFSALKQAEGEGICYASVGRPTFLTLAPWEVYQGIVAHDIQYKGQKSLDIRLIAWTIDEAAELRALVAMGVDGILTNRPARLARKVLGRKTDALLNSLPSRKTKGKIDYWGN